MDIKVVGLERPIPVFLKRAIPDWEDIFFKKKKKCEEKFWCKSKSKNGNVPQKVFVHPSLKNDSHQALSRQDVFMSFIPRKSPHLRSWRGC